MDILAKLIWNPFLSLYYLLLGAVFIYITDAIALKKSFRVCLKIFQNDKSSSNDRLVPHTKGLLSTLAATVGIGNLAGVGTAIHLGGPGALFWMWMSALIGMFFRMCSTYFAVKYRPADTKSLSFATPMVYLEKYMKGDLHFITPFIAGLIFVQGVVLSNLVQSNSLAHALHDRFDIPNIVVAVLLTLAVAAVVLGGLRKIVDFSSAIAPWMIFLYIIVGMFILLSHPVRTLISLGQVFYYAFTPYSIAGGIAGYTVFQSMQFGVSRGVFSHMSGLGTSTFLQGANEEPPAIGAFMSAITPFVDTIILCTITGLVILSTSFWQDITGAYLTLESFEFGIDFVGEVVVILSLIIFAYTTITAFSYISEKCYKYLGGKNIFGYRLIFLSVTFTGPFLNLNFVWSLSDVIIGIIIIFNLIPLLKITLLNLRGMLKDLHALKL